MRNIFAGVLLLLCCACTFAQSPASSPMVTITGANANYRGGTITTRFISQGGPSPTTTAWTGTISKAGTFSLISWNNAHVDYAPSLTTFTICTKDGTTCYTTPQVSITFSQDISKLLTLAPIPQK